MESTYKGSPLKRQGISILLVLQYLYMQIQTQVENVGHLFFHLTVFKRKTGFIQLGVEDNEADGKLRIRVIGEHGIHCFELINFRIGNRWIARNRRVCSSHLLWSIKSTVSTQGGPDGGDVHSVLWGRKRSCLTELKPFDLSSLPSDAVLARRHVPRNRLHGWLAKCFPARPLKSGPTEGDQARSIIFRV